MNQPSQGLEQADAAANAWRRCGGYGRQQGRAHGEAPARVRITPTGIGEVLPLLHVAHSPYTGVGLDCMVWTRS